MTVKTLIVRKARCSIAQPVLAATKPWGLYVLKIGRNLHEVGHFETREQALRLARILSDGRGDIRTEQIACEAVHAACALPN